MSPLEFLTGFRKFTFGLIAIILATIFLITHHIDGKVYGDVLKNIAVAFMGTNIAEHLIEFGKKYLGKK